MKIKYPEELNFLEIGKRPQYSTQISLHNKTYLISGATSGIGYESAKVFALHHAHLILLARNPEKAEKLKNELLDLKASSVEVYIADFAQLEDVRNVAKDILKTVTHLDGLINCAGIHSTKLLRRDEGVDEVFLVNHLASFLLTEMLTPLLVKSVPARILQINSEGHRFNGLDIEDLHWKRHLYTGLRGYGASKTAQLLCMLEQAKHLEGTQVTLNAMHPGDVKSNIGQNNGWLYRLFSKVVIQPRLKDPKISANAIYYLMAEPSLANIHGQFFHLTHLEKPAKHALDESMSAKVYQKSIELCGL